MVKPVRILNCTLCFVFAAIVLVASHADAQTTSRQNSVRSNERAARANWSPTRQSAARTSNTRTSDATDRRQVSQPVRQASNVAGSRVVPVNRVRQAQHEVPMPTPILQEGETLVETIPMDGQIHYEGVHEVVHDAGCDAMPGVACGCEAGGCDGYGRCTTAGCSTCGELCSPNAWRPAITIGLPQDGWVSYEYLNWWQDGMRLPPLVTTSSDPNVARANAGVLGQSTTQTLFGGTDVLDEGFDGARIKFGFWLDRCHTWAIAGEYFNLSQQTDSYSGTSSGNPILARPFFNTLTGLEDSELVAFPNVVSGNVTAQASSELWGGGFHFKRLRCCEEGCKSWLFCGCNDHYCSRTERLIGYRYLQLDERVRVTEDLTSTDTANPGSFDILDQFDVRNQFNGFDLGWKYRVTRGYWTYSARLRMAVGNTRQTVTINGQTTITDPNDPPPQTLEGGLLAQSSNIGEYKQNEFTIVPELNLDLGYQLTDHVRATFGYTFIYWSNVVRPGDQISRDLNPNLLPPQANPLVGIMRPGFAFDTTDYWVQGINTGLEYRW